MVSIITEFNADILTNKNKTAFFDLSDAGEAGYRYGYTPETLKDISFTTYELLTLKGILPGEGNLDFFSRKLEGETLRIFGDPLRSLKLNNFAIHCKLFNSDTLEKTFRSLIKWLRNNGYENIIFLCCPVKTSGLNQALNNAIN